MQTDPGKILLIIIVAIIGITAILQSANTIVEASTTTSTATRNSSFENASTLTKLVVQFVPVGFVLAGLLVAFAFAKYHMHK